MSVAETLEDPELGLKTREKGPSRKSWKELRTVVKNARKLQMTLSNSVPHSFTFHRLSSDGAVRFRLYFLGVPAGARENTILYADFDARTAGDPGSQDLAFQPLISFQGVGTTYTKEEQLLRERKRVGAYGITAYDYDASSRTFAFSCGSSVFTVTDTEDRKDAAIPITPHDVTASSPGGSCLDPKICPGCPNLVAFVRSGDLWVASSKPGGKHQSVKRLTYVGSIDCVTAGVVSFVVQEEFDRYTGFWWRPQPKASQGNHYARSGSAMHLDSTDEDEDTMTSSVSTHQILYEEVDESGVEPTNIVSSTEDKDNPKGYDTYRYPRAGGVNAKSELKLLELVYDSGAGIVSEVEELKLETPLEVFYPEMEYLVRAGWTPDGQYVWAQVLNRGQTKLALILIHVSAFVRGKSPVSPSSSSIRPNSTPQVGVDEDMLSLDEEKMPTGPPSSSRGCLGHMTVDHDAAGVTSSSPSPVQEEEDEDEEEEDSSFKCSGWGMWLVHEETNPAVWVNVGDILHFLTPSVGRDTELVATTSASASSVSDSASVSASTSAVSSTDDAGESLRPKDDHVSFIWASEKTDFNHLYLITVRIPQVPPVYHHRPLHNPNTATALPERCHILSMVPLTEGEWEVSKKDVWIDEDSRRLYFMGTRDTPMESHLYVLSLDAPLSSITSSIRRLTEPGHSHVVTVDETCSWYVSVFSSLSMPPSCRLYAIKEATTAASSSSEVSTLMAPVQLAADYSPPELFSYVSQRSGRRQYGLFYAPANAVPGEKYPTVLFVYGGPQVQLVTNSFKGLRFLRLHSMASLGVAVVVLDVRGSCHRGLQFEGHLKNRLGCVEVEDHIEGLHFAADELPSGRATIDLSRVAIHGWSYGGYLSLMGLAQRPDIFKLALAGAPVTSWEEYDTGYTERYMGTPSDNLTGYQKGSVLQRAIDFPDEENRLVIIHGLIDENVHFRHTSLIVNALIKACKPYQLQIYPNERHGIRQPDTSEHYETTILSFLLQHL